MTLTSVLLGGAKEIRRQLAGTLLRVTRGTDRDRWAKPENLHENWSSRTVQMARFVPPGSTVLEFGCGAGHLADHLPTETNYMPSDVVPRDGAIIIDLNSRILNLPVHDVAFLSGVFEYVHDIPRAAHAIADAGATRLVTSYAPCKEGITRERAARRRSGFVADYDRDTFIVLVASAGWKLEIEETWVQGDLMQLILVFER